MRKHKVYSRLPKAGLGNKLLVWARAYVFASENNLELFTSAWWGFQFGPWLRKEKQKRLYWGYFKEDSLLNKLRYYFFRLVADVVIEPESVVVETGQRKLFVFNSLKDTGFSDHFKTLKPHRQDIKAELYKRINTSLLKRLSSYPKPTIGIHVRRGDFKHGGSKVTPISFFVDAIKSVRAVSGEELEVTVFTDATRSEIAEILALPGVHLAAPKQDILDILLLSKSDICILSINSTFGLWAAFLNDGIVLKHHEEWNPDIRPACINEVSYEGYFDPSKGIDEGLKAHLKQFVEQHKQSAVKSSKQFLV